MSSARSQQSSTPTAQPMPEERCYLCDAMVERNDEVVRLHGLMMYRRRYEEDIRKGRS